MQDEYTSFVAGAPLVAGATVELLDPYDNTIVVAQGTTDSTGKVLISNIPEGTYLLDVEAANHDPYRGGRDRGGRNPQPGRSVHFRGKRSP